MSAHTPLPGRARTPAPKVDGLSAPAVGSLLEQLRGAVVRPGDSDYDQVRRVWNARRRPAPGVDRPPERRRRRDRDRRLRPRQRRCRWRCGAAGTVPPGTAPSTAGSSSISPPCDGSTSTPGCAWPRRSPV